MSEEICPSKLIKITEHLNLSEEITNEFISKLSLKTIKRRQFLCKQGEVFPYMCFVNSGLFKSYTIDAEYVQQILGFSKQGYWLSDIFSYVTKLPCHTTIEALEDSELLVISYEDLELLFSKFHLLETHFRKMLERRVSALMQDRYNMLRLNAMERYNNFMEKNDELALRLMQKDIASHLGIFPESLSRIRKSLATRKK